MEELVILYDDGNGYAFADSLEEIEEILALTLEYAETEDDKEHASGEVYYVRDVENGLPETNEKAVAIYKKGVRVYGNVKE